MLFELQSSKSLSLTKILREHVQNGVFASEQGVYHVNYILLSVLLDSPRGLSVGDSSMHPWSPLKCVLMSNLNDTVCDICHCTEQYGKLAAFGVAALTDLLWFILGNKRGSRGSPLLHLIFSSLNIQGNVHVPFLSRPHDLKACSGFCTSSPPWGQDQVREIFSQIPFELENLNNLRKKE